jgi:anti-sigma factor RsiW
MNCELYDDMLDDYVDGARAAGRPADARLAAFEAHLPGCARCQALVADFSSIRRSAVELDEMIPPPRLWAKIAASIDAEARKPWWQRSFGGAFSAWVPAAVAAALVCIIGGTIWFSRTAPAVPPQTASVTTAVTPAAEPAVAPAEQQYEDAIKGLQQLADAQKPSLDPKTFAVLQQNLAVVDRAISESRAALSNEPTSAVAQDSLLDALDTKVALLQDTVAIATDAADVSTDAADAAKELNQ